MAEEHGWKFAQCFGDKGDVDNVVEADIISTVEFDHSGDFLASGDKGGRVVLFERNKAKKGCEYKFYTEFQSHEPEFDYLKSLEIEEKINKIKWCRRQNNSHMLLTTNDKTIKLWKINEKSVKAVVDTGKELLRIPKLVPQENVIVATPKKIYSNAHAYHINSISLNSDGETFLSCDDLRINLWNLGIQDQSFNIVDIKPANMEELTEVITSAEFHPNHCNIFIYSTSKGLIKLGDMRMAALCDKSSQEKDDQNNKTFFTEIIQSISDVKFSANGKYILARDYLTLKVWDVNMDSKPVATISIHDHLKPKLSELYENDCIFDKFEASFSPDGNYLMTGSYSNYLTIFDRQNRSSTPVILHADKSSFKSKKMSTKNKILGAMKKKKDEMSENVDYGKKILHAAWHPKENSIAVAATNNLFIFSQNIQQSMSSFEHLLQLADERITELVNGRNLLESHWENVAKGVCKAGLVIFYSTKSLYILYDILDDICTDISHSVHKEHKKLKECSTCGSECQTIHEKSGLDIFGAKPEFDSGQSIQCGNCDRFVAPSRFAPHLDKCMGMGRNSRKRAHVKTEVDDENEDEFSDGKKKKKSNGKKQKKKKDDDDVFSATEELFPGTNMSKYVSFLDNEFIEIE